ncbi:hypothetical protein C4K29_3796 [Pseudomonas chlororaphis subsp. piscium]|nr:hypothetical protein C4K29_3796 [Pseudomonas chlororaphis subsp. piscium]
MLGLFGLISNVRQQLGSVFNYVILGSEGWRDGRAIAN